jgi:transposase-like protein
MEKRIAPSEHQAQELRALREGQNEAQSGSELLSPLIRLSTERILQEALEQEQTEALGRARYARRAGSQGYRHGDEDGTLKTAEGVLRLKVPQLSGRAEPVRSQLWEGVANTSESLKRLIVEM